MNDEIEEVEEVEVTHEQLIQGAIQHVLEAGLLFKAAGFEQTSKNILNFTTEAFKTLTVSANNAAIDKTKLDDKTYDTILANIFGEQ